MQTASSLLMSLHKRIIRLCLPEVREVLEEAGGVNCIQVRPDLQEIHFFLSKGQRGRVLRSLDYLRAAINEVVSVERIVLNSCSGHPLVASAKLLEESSHLINFAETNQMAAIAEEIHRIEARCQVAIRLNPELLAIIGQDGVVRDCNWDHQRIGHEGSEILGREIRELLPSGYRTILTSIRKALESGQVETGRFWHCTKPGMPFCAYIYKVTPCGAGMAIAIFKLDKKAPMRLISA